MPVPVAFVIVAVVPVAVAFDKVTVNVSALSPVESANTGTEIVAVVWPAMNVSVPDVAVKSVPEVALPPLVV